MSQIALLLLELQIRATSVPVLDLMVTDSNPILNPVRASVTSPQPRNKEAVTYMLTDSQGKLSDTIGDSLTEMSSQRVATAEIPDKTNISLLSCLRRRFSRR
jgi:hypothetical protein